MLGVFVSFAMRISDGFDPRALHQFAGVAQLAEQCFRKAKVVGSSPTIGSIQVDCSKDRWNQGRTIRPKLVVRTLSSGVKVAQTT